MPNGQEKLSSARFFDGYVYTVNKLLPDNFDEVDDALRRVYYSKMPITVSYGKNAAYARRQLERLIEEGGKIQLVDSCADIHIPDGENSLRSKLLHNFFIYTTGTVLFPKGSRLREFLKSKL